VAASLPWHCVVEVDTRLRVGLAVMVGLIVVEAISQLGRYLREGQALRELRERQRQCDQTLLMLRLLREDGDNIIAEPDRKTISKSSLAPPPSCNGQPDHSPASTTDLSDYRQPARWRRFLPLGKHIALFK